MRFIKIQIFGNFVFCIVSPRVYYFSTKGGGGIPLSTSLLKIEFAQCLIRLQTALCVCYMMNIWKTKFSGTYLFLYLLVLFSILFQMATFFIYLLKWHKCKQCIITYTLFSLFETSGTTGNINGQ